MNKRPARARPHAPDAHAPELARTVGDPGPSPARDNAAAAAAMAQPAMSTETRTSFEIKMIQAGHAGADRRVVYECNFSVDGDIAQAFMQYLRAHMREVGAKPNAHASTHACQARAGAAWSARQRSSVAAGLARRAARARAARPRFAAAWPGVG